MKMQASSFKHQTAITATHFISPGPQRVLPFLGLKVTPGSCTISHHNLTANNHHTTLHTLGNGSKILFFSKVKQRSDLQEINNKHIIIIVSLNIKLHSPVLSVEF